MPLNQPCKIKEQCTTMLILHGSSTRSSYGSCYIIIASLAKKPWSSEVSGFMAFLQGIPEIQTVHSSRATSKVIFPNQTSRLWTLTAPTYGMSWAEPSTRSGAGLRPSKFKSGRCFTMMSPRQAPQSLCRPLINIHKQYICMYHVSIQVCICGCCLASWKQVNAI